MAKLHKISVDFKHF